jgi:flavin-dependent dehydrogenase
MLDLLVAGGGPSGLATAILARQAGLRVKVVEPKPGTIDKACGEGLMPPAVAFLRDRLGVVPETVRPFRGVRYIRDGRTAGADFPDGAMGWGVRRLALHTAMRARAAALGVERIEGKVEHIVQHDDHVEAAGTRARALVAADGLRSGIRARLGLDLPPTRPRRLGVRQHFHAAPWSDFVEVHWSAEAEAYVTPVSEDIVGIAILYHPPVTGGEGRTPFQRLLSGFPELVARLGQPASTLRGAGPFERRVRSRVAGRVLLVGDAAGYLDPITGEGLRLGFDAAEAAVACMLADDLPAYEARWRALSRRYWWMTDGLLRVSRVGMARRLMVPFLERAPFVMRGVLGALAV